MAYKNNRIFMLVIEFWDRFSFLFHLVSNKYHCITHIRTNLVWNGNFIDPKETDLVPFHQTLMNFNSTISNLTNSNLDRIVTSHSPKRGIHIKEETEEWNDNWLLHNQHIVSFNSLFWTWMKKQQRILEQLLI